MLKRLLSILPLVLVAQFAMADEAGKDRQTYSIKEDLPAVGTKLKRNVVTASVPLNKRYEELTPEQQQILKSNYESMGERDEPPFPIYGLGPMFKTIHAIQERLRQKGRLTLYADVDSTGKAVSVSVMQTPDKELAQYVATLLLTQQYKPALCNGTPCRQQFLLDMEFRLEL